MDFKDETRSHARYRLPFALETIFDAESGPHYPLKPDALQGQQTAKIKRASPCVGKRPSDT